MRAWLLTAVLLAGACDDIDLFNSKKEDTSLADAARDLTGSSGVPVTVKPAKGSGKTPTEVLVSFQGRPELPPPELERAANLAVRKHAPGVTKVTLEFLSPPGARPPR